MTHVVPSLPCCAPLGQTDPEASVSAGREALDHWWCYPWYDSGADGVRPIDVSEPWFASWNLDWLWDWLRANWNLTFGGFSWPSTLLGWLAWITIGGLLILLVYLLVRTYLRRAGSEPEGPAATAPAESPDERERVESLPFPVKAARLDLLAEVKQHYRQGNYGEAIKYLFSYQLVRLDKQQIIRLASGKTNRQYLGEVGRRVAIRRLLEQTMVAFEDVFFGNHTLDRARFESCWSRLEQFETLVMEGTA